MCFSKKASDIEGFSESCSQHIKFLKVHLIFPSGKISFIPHFSHSRGKNFFSSGNSKIKSAMYSSRNSSRRISFLKNFEKSEFSFTKLHISFFCRYSDSFS